MTPEPRKPLEMAPEGWLTAVYHLRCAAADVEARAEAIALEQSVELPLSAVTDEQVRREIVGRVTGIAPAGPGLFEVRIDLAAATTGGEPGQLMNMLFGNTSLHDDVTLTGAELPAEFALGFGGPRHGIHGLRARVRADRRALTCTALKPQGLAPSALAELAGQLAAGGLDYIKDDHGLADQAYSRYADRVPACAAAVAAANSATGHAARYVPSLSGPLDEMRAQLALARGHGIDTVMVAPMIAGLSNAHRLIADNPDIAFLAHPSFAGASRVAPPLLLGKLFRLIGFDATIFPHYGGRFGYAVETCNAIADAARTSWHGFNPSLPVPAGGMTLDRVPELLDFYGPDTMLLIGGSLLSARDRLTEAAHAFAAQVAGYEAEHV